jgi:hypothetical protein
MRRSLTLSLFLAFCPVLASAGPVSFGAGIGLSKSTGAPDAAATEDLGLLGRISLGWRLSLQAELHRAQVDNPTFEQTSGSILAVVDLAHGTWVPLLLAGAGLDRGSVVGESIDAHHFEAGLGMELRSKGGMFVGADARLGEIDVDQQPALLPQICFVGGCPMNYVHAGEYRSVRATVGVRF